MALVSVQAFPDFVLRRGSSLDPDFTVGIEGGNTVKLPRDAIYVDAYYQDTDKGDWALASARAHAANPVVNYRYGGVYPFKSTWTITSSAVLNMFGATLVMAADTKPVVVDYEYLSLQSISAFAVQNVDFSKGTSGTTPVSVVTVSSSAGYSVNDIVKVASDDLYPDEDPADRERAGEFVTVAQTAAGQVTFFSTLIDNYTTNPRMARMDSSKRLVMRGGRAEKSVGSLPSWNEAFFTVIGAVSPVFEGMGCDELVSEHVRLQGCFNARTTGFDDVGLDTDLTVFRVGYGVVSYSSYFGQHTGHYCSNGRHLYANGVRGTDAGGDIRYHGATAYETVAFNRCMNMQNAALDAHGQTFACNYSNNMLVYAFNGPTGSRRGIAVRGNDHLIQGNIVYGGTGYEAYTSYGKPGNSSGHVFSNNWYFQNENHPDTRPAYRAIGRAGQDGNQDCIVTAKFIDNHAVMYGGATPGIYAELAKIELGNIDIKQVLVDAGQAVVEATTKSVVTVIGGTFDVSGSSGTTQSLFKTTTADSTINYSGYGRLIGAGDIDGILNANSIAATINVLGLDSDATLAAPTLGTSGGALVTLDYTTNGGRTSGYNTRTPATLTVGPNVLDIQFRAAPRVFTRVRALNVGCEITGMTPGNYIGQIQVVTNRTDSTQSFVLKNGGTLMSIVADITLAVGQATQLIWDGTNWLRAA